MGGPNSENLTESLARGGGLNLFHFLSLLCLDTVEALTILAGGGKGEEPIPATPKRLRILCLFLFGGLGRVIESPHPLKDNYKLKETVHIPGARCLYLKFDSKERHLSVLYD